MMKRKLYFLKTLVILFLLFLLTGSKQLVAQAIHPFTCQDAVSYISHASTNNGFTGLYAINLITENRVTVKAPANIKFNAIGYCTLDNFIYGHYAGTSATSATATNQIIKLDAGGNHSIFTVNNLPVDTYEAGDVDANGNLYLYSAKKNFIYKIDLFGSSLSATAIQLTDGAGGSGAATLNDISVNSNGSLIWGVSNLNGNFITYTNGVRTFRSGVNNQPFPGMTFYDSRGLLFIASEGTGNLYLTNPFGGSIDKVVHNTSSIIYHQGDGAQCRNASVYTNSQPNFSCEAGVAYVLSQETESMYRIDTKHNDYTLAANDITGSNISANPNNMGYNPKDGYLWVYRTGTSQLMRIGSDYSVQYFTIPNLSSSGGYNAGEFSPEGIFYFYNGKSPTSVIRRLDMNPSSPTFMQFIKDLDIKPIGFSTSSSIVDIAYNPQDKNLYGVSALGSLMQINTTNGELRSLGKITGPGASTNSNNTVVIAFSDPSGNLYFERSDATNMWKISKVHTGNTVSEAFKANLTAHHGGDGARCAESAFDNNLLPVTLGNITAFIQNGHLVVNWQTAAEKNNDHFEIEISKDGKHWKKAGRNIVRGNADGNSDINTLYTKDIPLNSMAAMGLSLFLLSTGVLLRRNKWLGAALIAISISTVLYGCRKISNPVLIKGETMYVRIKQVDINGSVSYSKVVKATVK